MKALQSVRDMLAGPDAAATSGLGNKKRAAKFTEINQNRVVLFDFVAAKEYPEQVSVRAGEVVFVFEAFPDGWCEVKTPARIGVIPSAYHGPVPKEDQQPGTTSLQRHEDATLSTTEDGGGSPPKRRRTSSSSSMDDFVRRQARALARMAQDKFWERLATLGLLAVQVARYLVVDVAVPLGQRAVRIASKNENKSTTLLCVARVAFQSVAGTLIPMLTDEELLLFNNKLQEDAARVKAERVHRRENANSNSTGNRMVKTMSLAALPPQ